MKYSRMSKIRACLSFIGVFIFVFYGLLDFNRGEGRVAGYELCCASAWFVNGLANLSCSELWKFKESHDSKGEQPA